MEHKRLDADVLWEEYNGEICVTIVDREDKD